MDDKKIHKRVVGIRRKLDGLEMLVKQTKAQLAEVQKDCPHTKTQNTPTGLFCNTCNILLQKSYTES